jgi:hypothetical protein
MTDELKKEFEKLCINEHGYFNFCCEAYKHDHKEDVAIMWNFIEQSLKSQQEQVLREYNEYLKEKYTVGIANKNLDKELDAFLKELGGK